MKIAITGAPGSGKTTLCRRLIEALPLKVGGILTQDIRQDKIRVGFELLDIAAGQKGILSHVDLKGGPKVGKYTVHLADIERIAIPALERALKEAELIVIDEIAPMELKSPAFVRTVQKALSAPKPLLVTFKRHFEHPLIAHIRREFSVYEITPHNRGQLLSQLLMKLKGQA